MFPRLLALSLMFVAGLYGATHATSKAQETGSTATVGISTVAKGYSVTVGDDVLTVPPSITVEFNNESYETVMTLDTYRTKIWNQYRWTNRALRNRCRDRFDGLEEFTKTPLKEVLPGWRDDHVRWAKNKHHRAQEKSSLCAPWPGWWYDGAMCIHSHEGAWNDPNAPYWGGMQMDISFMTSYGPEFYKAKGTADHWTPYEQLLASWRAYQSRGWGPWPLTRTYCGL